MSRTEALALATLSFCAGCWASCKTWRNRLLRNWPTDGMSLLISYDFTSCRSAKTGGAFTSIKCSLSAETAGAAAPSICRCLKRQFQARMVQMVQDVLDVSRCLGYSESICITGPHRIPIGFPGMTGLPRFNRPRHRALLLSFILTRLPWRWARRGLYPRWPPAKSRTPVEMGLASCTALDDHGKLKRFHAYVEQFENS